MKFKAKILDAIFLFSIVCLIYPNGALAQPLPPPQVSLQTFYDELSPYGEWLQNPNYQGYVWIPNAGPYFAPYQTAGHWVYTDYGWTWVSDYIWGWAPFHYGRWDKDPYYGWYWVPGPDWAPAWVCWSRSPGYYGWAPMQPGVDVAFYNNGYMEPADRWVFVDERYVADPYGNQYYAPPERTVIIYQNTTVINNTYVDNTSNTTYASGPHVAEVQNVSAVPVTKAAITNSVSPGRTVINNNQISIYRPAVTATPANSNAQPAPQRVTDRQTITPVETRKNANPQAIQPGKMNTPAPFQKPLPIKTAPAPIQNDINKMNNNPQSQPRAVQQAPANQQQKANTANKNVNNQQVKTIYVCPNCGAIGTKGGKCAKCGKYFVARTVKK